jgi:hypothetical protein
LIRATERGEIRLDRWGEKHLVPTCSIGRHDECVARALGEIGTGMSHRDVSDENGEG